MNSLTLRKASPGDSEFAYCTRRAAFKEYVEKIEAWDDDEQRQLHKRRFGEQDFRIINQDGMDVGIMAVVKAPDCVKVNQLFILPEHQGRGIGRESLLVVMQQASRLRLPVRLRVLKVNKRALAFFQRLGFYCIGETDTHILMERAAGSKGDDTKSARVTG